MILFYKVLNYILREQVFFERYLGNPSTANFSIKDVCLIKRITQWITSNIIRNFEYIRLIDLLFSSAIV